eukprot:TRINITY_DN6514_c0_g1_i1.p1 TRINITY_DN6514_c0_g1~~TRINITY_DN6514_c0_g1_i1.p1  ORF type:complete len:589 (-),score=133.24 TRINITY_DN6514_c0_g1_i1:164-1897(-)
MTTKSVNPQGDGDAYYLEPVDLEDDSDDDFKYDEVDVGSGDDDDLEEDFNTALKTIKAKEESAPLTAKTPTAVVERKAEVIDDFVRNFLHRVGCTRTLDAFQAEWYERKALGKISSDLLTPVPDAYGHNKQLEEEIMRLKGECEKYKSLATKARSVWDKLRKERDHHRMHHRRVVQEKDSLLTDVRRLKKHIDGYEPTLTELQRKYELAMKEKMMMRLERDRAISKAEMSETRLAQLEGATQPLDETPKSRSMTKKRNKDSTMPTADRENPFVGLDYETGAVESWSNSRTIAAHNGPVVSMALHPKRPMFATCSDDATWKLWSIAQGEMLMTATGHSDWVSDIDFHPRGTLLASSSGDGTVKIWDFATAACTATFADHSSPVWSVAFHDSGDFVASGGMDHTARLWDLGSARCRTTFRGHTDTVNQVGWQPFTNTLVTCSGDKTISLWDARSGLLTQTFYGHKIACNFVSFNNRGDALVSTDVDGVVKVWDPRTGTPLWSFSNPAGNVPCNKAAFDRSGVVVAVGSDDHGCKLYNIVEGKQIGEWKAHTDSVQAVAFDATGKYAFTCGSDGSVRVWQ